MKERRQSLTKKTEDRGQGVSRHKVGKCNTLESVNKSIWLERKKRVVDGAGCKIRSQILKGFVYFVKKFPIYPKGSGNSLKDFKHRDNMINIG